MTMFKSGRKYAFVLTEMELRINVEVPLKDRKGESFICCVAQKHILLRNHHISFSKNGQIWALVCACAYVCKSGINMDVLVLFLKNTSVSVLVRNSEQSMNAGVILCNIWCITYCHINYSVTGEGKINGTYTPQY